MYPILIDWGPIFLPAWHFFYVLGAIAAYFLLQYLNSLSLYPIASHHLNTAYIVSYVAGYFGARIFTIIIANEGDGDFSRVMGLLFSFGGMTFYGGFLSASVAAAIYVGVKKLPFWGMMDLAVLPVLIGLVLGRIGCFLNGDDFGRPIVPEAGDLPWWAVTFPNLDDNIARYPVQLMESLAVLCLVVFLCLVFRRVQARQGRGVIGLVAVAGYAVLRIVLEMYRGDERGWLFHPMLSTSQAVSLVLLVFVAILAIIRWRQIKFGA